MPSGYFHFIAASQPPHDFGSLFVFSLLLRIIIFFILVITLISIMTSILCPYNFLLRLQTSFSDTILLAS